MQPRIASYFIICASLLVVDTSEAQTNGSISVRGWVGAVSTVRAVGFVSHNGVVAELGEDNGVSAALRFGGPSAALDRPLAGTLTLALRSNAAYALHLAATAEDRRTLSKVKLSISDIRPSGTRTSPAAVSRARVVGNAASTVAELDGRQILRGPPISLGGKANAPDNALLVDLTASVSPEEVVRHGDLQLTLWVTISNP